MNSNERFFIWVWSLCAAVLVVFTVSIAVYNTHYSNTVARMVLEGGVDPMRIKCAMNDSLGDDPVCMILINNTSTGE
jgi:hypothetical protein